MTAAQHPWAVAAAAFAATLTAGAVVGSLAGVGLVRTAATVLRHAGH